VISMRPPAQSRGYGNAGDVGSELAGRPRFGVWVGYAAVVCALLFAVPSFYWAAGGKAGTDTIGRQAVESNWDTNPTVMTVVLVTAGLKALGGLLALALVRGWGRRFPRWMLPTAAWGAALVLTLYGGAQLTTQVLIKLGAIQIPDDVDWHAFAWHLYLWSPWFVLWGVLMGLTAWCYHRRPSPTATTATPPTG